MTSFERRFWAKVDRSAGPDACWPWLATIDRHGYGQFTDKERHLITHRVAFELTRGPIPNGRVLDHLCRNRACANPAHVEVVTNRENILRGEGITAHNARKTHCKHGHALSGPNLLRVRGGRACRECHRADARAWAIRNRKPQGASV